MRWCSWGYYKRTRIAHGVHHFVFLLSHQVKYCNTPFPRFHLTYFILYEVSVLTVQTNLKFAAKLLELTPDATKNEKQKLQAEKSSRLGHEIIVQL